MNLGATRRSRDSGRGQINDDFFVNRIFDHSPGSVRILNGCRLRRGYRCWLSVLCESRTNCGEREDDSSQDTKQTFAHELFSSYKALVLVFGVCFPVNISQSPCHQARKSSREIAGVKRRAGRTGRNDTIHRCTFCPIQVSARGRLKEQKSQRHEDTKKVKAFPFVSSCLCGNRRLNKRTTL